MVPAGLAVSAGRDGAQAAEDRRDQHAGPGRVAGQRLRDREPADAVSNEDGLAGQPGRDLDHVVGVRPQGGLRRRAALAVPAQAHRVRRVAPLGGVLQPVLRERPGAVAVPGHEQQRRPVLVGLAESVRPAAR